MPKTISLVILMMTNISFLFSQCLDFNVNSNGCIDESILLSNLSGVEGNYFWDFCNGDLLKTPNSSVPLTIGGLSEVRGMDVVFDGTEWFGFVTGRSSNNITRLDFGADVASTPVVVSLGNIDNMLDGPEPIKIVSQNDLWYGFVHNGVSKNLIRLDFGVSLKNIPTASEIIPNIGGVSSKLDVGYSNDSLIMVMANFSSPSSLDIINFGEDITAIPSVDDYFNTSPNGVASWTTSISLIKQCNSWYGVSENLFAGNLYLLSFGNSLFHTPDVIEVGTNIFGVNDPTRSRLVIDNNQFLAYSIMSNGNLYQVNMGDDLLTPTSVVNNLGTLSNLSRSYELKFVKSGTNNFAFSIDRLSGKLVRLDFPNECNSSISFSESFEPTGLSYNSAGNQYISQSLVDDFENIIETKYNLINIGSDVSPSISYFQNTFCLTSPIQFTSESSSGGLTYTWDFGDGSPTSGDASPTHTYSIAGDYEVILTVDDGTCGNFTKQTITIYDEPAPDFSVPGGNICTNQPYLFENTTPGDFGGFITYSWVLDGVPISADQDLDITFSSGGTKELKLVASIPGCDIEIAKNLSNIKEGTLPVFSFDDSCVGEEVLFTNSTLGDITDVNWEFSNGFTSTLSSPTMVFDEEGTYDVTLNIINADGCETFDTQTITIHALPVIDFSNELACEELATQFEDLSTVNIDNLSSWSWDFGDGSDVSNDQNASHIFDANGDYEVELTAISSFGCIDSLTKTVAVLKAPEASFDFDKICLDVPIQFTDASTAVEGEEITDWSWNLGGTFSAQQNPQVTFENSLDYTVSLTVTSSNLCTATQTQLISIPETPTLDFSLVDDCENETGQISDVTEIFGDNISNRSWLINGNQVSSESTFEYDFVQAGNYDVTLMLNTENGCEYETIRPVTIHPAPTSNFVTSFDFGAPPFVVDFTNQSSGAQTYSWKFEDGAVSDDLNPSYTFNNLGDFDVLLVAISDQNCTDTTSRRIQVLEPLLDAEVLNFNILPTATGDKLSFAIRNNGTIRLDSLSVNVNLGGELEIYETINRAMNPNEVISAQLALTLDNKRLDYICIDVKPFISNYQDVDEDNNRSCITFGQETFIVSNPYPNPSTSLVAFDVIATKDAVANIELLSSEGHLLNAFNIEVFQGNNKLDFDLSQLKSGLYFLKVKLDGLNKVRRIVINN